MATLLRRLECDGLVFFFSSRRRHTRSLCDWSSDVCSSDLTSALWRAPASLRTRAFYEGGGALADRPALARAGRVRGVRRRRAPDSWRRLRARRPHPVLPAADRAGGSPRVLAVGRHVARDRRLVPQARERRPRLRARRPAAGRDRPRAASRGLRATWSRQAETLRVASRTRATRRSSSDASRRS